MRALFVSVAGLLGLILTPALAAANSAYSAVRVGGADQCAMLCDTDGLCISWRFRDDGLCELSAVALASDAESDANSGLSRRAPAFAHRLTARVAPPRATATLVDAAPAAATAIEDQLLGGPG